jgi:hypothetical protein
MKKVMKCRDNTVADRFMTRPTLKSLSAKRAVEDASVIGSPIVFTSSR